MTSTNWKPKKLNELGFVGRGRSRHRPRNAPELYGGPYPFIQTADIMASEMYIYSYSKTYSEFGLAQSKMWNKGTLCMTIAGENTAETAILGIDACFPDSVVAFIDDPKLSDVRFVKYYLDTMKSSFKSVSRGATQDNLSLDKLLSFDLIVPDVNLQRRIADILSAYDDLIENNIRRIRILEQMAQASYQEWFGKVDKESLPEGWRSASLGELIDFTKGKKPKETSPSGAMPLLMIESIQNGITEFTDDSNIVVAEANDVVMVMDGASSGKVFLGQYGAVGSTLGRYRPKDREIFSHYHLYLFIQANLRQIADNNIGSAIPHANKDFINQLKVFLPPPESEKQFHDQMKPVFDLISTLQKKNTNLRQTRDLLLPRLVRGEIEV